MVFPCGLSCDTTHCLSFGIVEYLLQCQREPALQPNLIEVSLMEENGTKLAGWENAFYPAHQIREWLERHCASQGRKKHVMSTLQSRMADEQHVPIQC
jgi:hypothetical protein